jgi:predicted O-methyltransferase YrrM
MKPQPTTLNDYIEAHTSPEPKLLHEINRQTHLNVLQPRMLSGHLQGRLLAMISRMVKPNRILELGTFTGYSALCLAEGLTADGQLITIDSDDELQDLILENFSKYHKPEALKLIVGEALSVLPCLSEKFDLVFIDADKTEYPSYLTAIKQLLNSGAFVIADNVLWDSKVLDPENHTDASTKALVEFNRMVQDDLDFQNVLLPVRDGLMVMEYKQ